MSKEEWERAAAEFEARYAVFEARYKAAQAALLADIELVMSMRPEYMTDPDLPVLCLLDAVWEYYTERGGKAACFDMRTRHAAEFAKTVKAWADEGVRLLSEVPLPPDFPGE